MAWRISLQSTDVRIGSSRLPSSFRKITADLPAPPLRRAKPRPLHPHRSKTEDVFSNHPRHASTSTRPAPLARSWRRTPDGRSGGDDVVYQQYMPAVHPIRMSHAEAARMLDSRSAGRGPLGPSRSRACQHAGGHRRKSGGPCELFPSPYQEIVLVNPRWLQPFAV